MSKAVPLALYPVPTAVRSSILKHPPDAVPPVEDLESLYAELQNLKQKALERLNKTKADAKLIEDGMRRMRDREREKKELLKVKRERDFTPIPDSDKRLKLDKEKKKKRKREQFDDDSDIEMALADAARPRKATPSIQVPAAQQKVQTAKPSPSISVTKASSTPVHAHLPDFSVYKAKSFQDYMAVRPPVVVPTPGPSKPVEVTEDFSKLKVPSQTAVSTFYTSIEPFIRPLREEDVGWLEWSGEEEECFVFPPLGRWYKDCWEERDHALSHGLPAPPANEAAVAIESLGAPEPLFDPSQINDQDCQTENRAHGPLTERVISAFIEQDELFKEKWKGVKAAEDAMEGRPGGSGAAASRKERMNVREIEERVRDTMRYYGLLDEIPKFESPSSDDVSALLRINQNALRETLNVNKARREILIERAKERLAYQEYVDARDAIDKAILNAYTKLQKKDLPKPLKKKKKGDKAGSVAPSEASSRHDGVGEDGTPVPPVPTVPPAALGLVLDEDNRLVVPDHLKTLINVRKELVNVVGSVFNTDGELKESKLGKPLVGGWRMPSTSVFTSLEVNTITAKVEEPAAPPPPPPDDTMMMDVDPPTTTT